MTSTHAEVTTLFLNRSRSAASDSWAVCNEGAYDGNLPGMLTFMWDFFKDLLPAPIKSVVQ